MSVSEHQYYYSFHWGIIGKWTSLCHTLVRCSFRTEMKQDSKITSKLTIADAYIQHRDVLFGYFAHKMLKPEDIEDLLQETFIEAFKSEAKRTINSPKDYLFVVARNLMSKKFAKRAKMRTESIDAADFNHIASKDVSTDLDVHYKLKLKVLARCVDTLPDQCRRVFILKKFRGMSQKQIASHLNISTSTVERHITIALMRLNTLMAEHGYNEDSNVESSSVVRSIK